LIVSLIAKFWKILIYLQSQQPKDLIKHSKNSSTTGNSSTENTSVSNNISGSSSSATDLINTANDPLIGTVLQRLPIDTLDRLNAVARQENRQVLIVLYFYIKFKMYLYLNSRFLINLILNFKLM